MTTELAAAIERLRNAPPHGMYERVYEDMRTVVDAYLAEHPPVPDDTAKDARQAAERAAKEIGQFVFIGLGFSDSAITKATDRIIAEFAPLLAAKDAERDALKDQCRYFRDGHADIARGVKAGLKLEHWPEFTGSFKEEVARLVGEVVAERDRLKKQVEQLRGLVRELRGYVEDHGTPDNLKALDAALTEQPND